MARKCYITGKGSKAGNNRSHSLQATRRTWKANLQKVRIKDEDGRVVRVLISTSTLRTAIKNNNIITIKVDEKTEKKFELVR